MTILRSGYIGSDTYTLERRVVPQGRVTSLIFVICDEFGSLYAFPHRSLAEWHWRDMGIRSLAQREAA